MKENILILSILIACAFSGGVMVAGGLLPPGALYAAIGGVVLVSIMALFVGAVLGVVWLFKRSEKPAPADPLRTYRPYPNRAIHGRFDGPAIDHQHVRWIEGHHQGHVDPWPTLEPAEDPRRELPTPARREIPWKK